MYLLKCHFVYSGGNLPSGEFTRLLSIWDVEFGLQFYVDVGDCPQFPKWKFSTLVVYGKRMVDYEPIYRCCTQHVKELVGCF